MLKKPDYKSIIILTMMFLIGLAMIVIPLIQQRQEINDDNNIYAMIAEEIRHQQAAAPVPEPEAEVVDEYIPMDEPEPELAVIVEEVPNEEQAEAEEITSEEEKKQPDEIPVEPILVEPVLPTAVIATEPESTSIPAVPTSEPASPVRASPVPTQRPAAEATRKPIPQNEDYVAWISIPGTPVDYPVVRSDRSEYYLHHLITGQESKLGCLFSLKTSDYETPSKNIAIYGHHLSNSTAMFSSLLEYKKESYWRNHPVIRLKSIYGDRSYRIFAVLNHTVSDWDASTASFKDDSAFLRFVNRAKAKAFYDTGIPVSEEDHIITLITCDRSFGGVQGRLLVMGVEQ